MKGHGKSDSSVVPKKPPNKAAARAAEVVEGRELAKGNSTSTTGAGHSAGERLHSALGRVREAARDKRRKFTALYHHIYDVERLRKAYLATKRDAAAGVDGVTWKAYGQELEQNLQRLSQKLKQGAYRARPVRRAYIPKADGRRRPLGVPALEDKIVQRATVEVMNAIYERDFLGFNYGFRPGRSQHMALDALAVGVTRRRVNWVLDADIRSFFDTMEQGWIVKFVEHRIADRRVVRLIQKWLRAGVLEEGKHIVPEEGAVQGGSISPLLSNLYLHYVLDLWVQKWRQTRAHGGVAIVRFADDFVMGFERKDEAEQFLVELKERFLKFGLELHPEKTRLIEFGRKPYEQRKARGKRRPETFNFLGFKHCCAQNGRGYFVILRQTMGSRMSAKLKALKEELRRRWHLSVPEQGQYLQAVLAGHYRYYGVPYNSRALRTYRHRVVRIWRRALIRRGGKRRPNWAAIAKHAARWLPQPRIHHPYPSERFAYE